jgi:hypothetical protein
MALRTFAASDMCSISSSTTLWMTSQAALLAPGMIV